ncbi:DUF2167 domain-containing protein [Hymenobacter busanensis]|uniref:DUF2167 domain-containing protein n=1 Tax=Hymenobacter busanensis TaxID=2607656 RepID=UPI0013679351|nr:DUF2167 domain-containing protein [Hymenobacter busanensis]QHJ09144.1 DUF2167 domain-containing protein [Hymenobacter busanensis]
MKHFLRLLCLLLAPVLGAQAGTTPVDSAALFKAKVDSLNASFRYQTGTIKLGKDLGSLSVPKDMRFLDAEQSKRVLTKIWGNPETAAEDVQGMLFPLDKGPVSENNWAFVVSYEPMGYVKDDDAEDINYDDLLKDMQEEIREGNAARREAGYAGMELLGWAVPPHYDKATHALHWAKKLQFDNNAAPTLNYDVRLLGRKGVLSLNAVADPIQLGLVESQIPAVVKGTDFAQGLRYADFDPKLDEVAAYSIGGLVAGKVLAKVGALAVIAKFGKAILLVLLKGWKFILLALGAGWSFIRRFFTGRGKEDAEPTLALDEAAADGNPPTEM